MVYLARGLNRRDFVRRVSAGLAAIPAAGALGLVDVFAQRRSRVALVRTADRKRGVAAAITLLDPRGIAGKRVVLKPNFNSADDAPASTHNDTLAQLVVGLVGFLCRFGQGVGERAHPAVVASHETAHHAKHDEVGHQYQANGDEQDDQGFRIHENLA